MGLPRSHGALVMPLRNWPQSPPKRRLPHILQLPHTHPLTNAHILQEHRHPLALPPSLTLKHTHRIPHKNTSNHIPSQTPANAHMSRTLFRPRPHTPTSLSHTDSSTHLLRGPHHATDTPSPTKSQMMHSLRGQQSQIHNYCNLHHRQAHTHTHQQKRAYSHSEMTLYTLMSFQSRAHT